MGVETVRLKCNCTMCFTDLSKTSLKKFLPTCNRIHESGFYFLGVSFVIMYSTTPLQFMVYGTSFRSHSKEEVHFQTK